jgi:hypothetical protein
MKRIGDEAFDLSDAFHLFNLSGDTIRPFNHHQAERMK